MDYKYDWSDEKVNDKQIPSNKKQSIEEVKAADQAIVANKEGKQPHNSNNNNNNVANNVNVSSNHNNSNKVGVKGAVKQKTNENSH